MNDEVGRIKHLANTIVEMITPFIQSLSKLFKVGFVGHIILELVVVLIMLVV